MIAYSIKALSELEILEKAKKWLDKKIISAEQHEQIKQLHTPNLFIPNIFVRVGLFFVTLILVNAALGLISLFNVFFDSSAPVIGGFLLFFGIVITFALEGFISEKKTYCAGIDDGLLYLGVFYLVSGTSMVFYKVIDKTENEILYYTLLALPFFAAAAIRYLDNLMTFIAFCCFIIIIFFSLYAIGGWFKALIPFFIMIGSSVSYYLSYRYAQNDNFHFWRTNLKTLQFLSLLTFFLAGNYFVVRELSIEMLNLSLKEGEDIPFAILFHLTTLIIPIGYIYYGGRLRDRILFVGGLIALALAVLTFKYYYSIAPIGYSLTLGGLLLVGLVVIVIKYFNLFKFRITSEKENELLPKDTEALVISYSFPQQQISPSNQTSFGGGDFGGGGSGGSY